MPAEWPGTNPPVRCRRSADLNSLHADGLRKIGIDEPDSEEPSTFGASKAGLAGFGFSSWAFAARAPANPAAATRPHAVNHARLMTHTFVQAGKSKRRAAPAETGRMLLSRIAASPKIIGTALRYS